MNNFLPKLGCSQSTADKSAYSRARHKLKPEAFIELNQKAVVDTMYEDGDYAVWHGHRILAIDGSRVILPTNDETIARFGTVPYDNKQTYAGSNGEHALAIASVLYDVLNRISIDAALAPANSYEGDLAREHLKHAKVGDLVIYDRGYASFRMMALATQANVGFLIRCPKGRFSIATAMLTGKGTDDVIVSLQAPANFHKDPRNTGLPDTLTVRFARITLDDGAYEVLATSLTNQQEYPLEDFKELYYLRWGVETFYGILKTRLILENFSGYSVNAIRQDFFAAVFLTGAETILTKDAEEQLGKQRGGRPKKVNKAVSFNLIKEHAFELFYSKQPDEQRLEELTNLFMTSPTLIRKDRNPPRKNSSSHRILGFWKRQRKEVF
jgi:hypothetical protein